MSIGTAAVTTACLPFSTPISLSAQPLLLVQICDAQNNFFCQSNGQGLLIEAGVNKALNKAEDILQ